ncbi:NCS2 family nucleobase:cation symporter-2 [Hydrogenoanaerobacterium saccharovorans]|uniref:Nucleobase:cation symporter-2, NCS2 family n=1 Tax=Hydrogenoanaerobacterium saccharovorans TaxID=474960 RepID=A0A1H7YZ60_9FIRM|nr:nucleobase:cation symporter-2 family protein [Hydrogenoanaerobacterium saccharovorans]RPF48908.1 NCS2 family nucleobase:cation symporter-2 [Hydrogenoanaerobacterium saccharovorans]SEM51582.1 nucleobase:cation symporter-2, NCS2 family [Hydrogenoanaerobacterium saccharovorans]
MKEAVNKNPGSLFSLDGVPSLKQIVPLGLQHVVAAIVGVVTPALLVSNVCNLSPADKTLLVQSSLLISAIATLLQLFPFAKKLGSGLPVIMGVSFAYVPTLLAIGGEFGIATIFGSQIIGGLVAIVVGLFVKKLMVLFPPLVTGTVIFTIGLSLYPTAVNYMAGGKASPTFGSPQNWLVALITFAIVVFFNYFTKGSMKLAAILIGMVSGYVVALFMNMVNFDSVTAAGWFSLPKPMHFGIVFQPTAIVSMVIIYIVNAVQTIGDLSSTTTGGLDRMPTHDELTGGIVGNGIASVIGAFFGGMPTATYSQNVGIVTVNRVVNRVVFGFAAGVLLVAGFVPKFASVLTTIPQSVIGGATISVFATITMTGIKMIASQSLTPRNTAVVGLSVALGAGIVQATGSLQLFPSWVPTVFGSSSVVVATLMAVFLNVILPKDKTETKK